MSRMQYILLASGKKLQEESGSVSLVDHSYFPRLMRSMRDTNRECTTARTECNYSCRWCDTIAKLVANVLFVKLAKHRLRRVIFGVDQDKCWADAAELAGDLFHLGRPCLAEFGVQKIRCCTVLPRGHGSFPARTPKFPTNVEPVNVTVQRVCVRST